jgi:hypothetical protein
MVMIVMIMLMMMSMMMTLMIDKITSSFFIPLTFP